MRDAELADLNAGRIRLADLSDSDDEYYRSGRRKGKKSKRKKNRSKQKEYVEDKIEIDTKDDDVIQDVKNEDTMPQDVKMSVEEVGDIENDTDVAVKEDDQNHEEESSSSLALASLRSSRRAGRKWPRVVWCNNQPMWGRTTCFLVLQPTNVGKGHVFLYNNQNATN